MLRSDQCTDICPNGTFLNNNSKTCDLCPTGCKTCTSFVSCQSCLPAYGFKSYLSGGGLINSSICSICYIGWVTVGGCTTEVGCTDVRYFLQTDIIGTCLSCETKYTWNSSTYSCECNAGTILAGQFCTPVFGCVSTVLVSENVICQFCDSMGHFLFDVLLLVGVLSHRPILSVDLRRWNSLQGVV